MIFALRLGIYSAALTLVFGGLFMPALRHEDGWLSPESWAVVVVGLAVAVAGHGWHRRWQAAGWWFGVALIGQGAALQLIFAPPYGIYQHVLSLGDIAGSWRVACLIGLLAHGLYVGWASRKAWPNPWRAIRAKLGPLRLLVLLGFLFNAGILVSTDGLQYGFGVIFVAWVGVAGALNLMLAVRALPLAYVENFKRLAARCLSGAAAPRLTRWLPWAVAFWVLCISAFIARFVYEGVPHLADSIAYLFQAKYSALGRLYLPVPPDDVAFYVSHLINDGEKIYGYGFPGWPPVLALGVLVGAPWLVNPVLGGVTILLAHALLRRLYDDGVAHAVVLLLAVSPWFLYMSANFMPHTLSLVLALAAFLAVEHARKDACLLPGLAAGAALGLLFLTRPLEGIMMSLAVGLRILGIGGVRPPFRIMLTICLGGILVGGAIFPYNQALTGDALYTPQQSFRDSTWGEGVDRLGFGPDIGNVGWANHDPLPGHSPINAVLNANKNFYMANLELFGWGFGSLAFIALAFLFKGWRSNDLLFWGIIVIILLVTALYWHPGGPDFGARYWYQLIIPFMVLTVRGAQLLAERIDDPDGAGLAGTRVGLFIIAACLTALINFMPWRAAGKYHHYKEFTDAIAVLAAKSGFETGALVFVRSLSNRAEDNDNDYPSAFILNSLNLTGPNTVYARDLGPESRARVRALFPERPVWIIGRDEAGKPIRVRRSPRP